MDVTWERNDKKPSESDSGMTDFQTWAMDNDDKIFRYWVYKRIFTPYENDKKFMDESVFENDECNFGYIKEAIELPDGDILIGFKSPYYEEEYIEYYKLSNISMAYDERDNNDYGNIGE